MLFIRGEQLGLQWRHLIIGATKKIKLFTMIDRGHRELFNLIFVGKKF